MYIYTRCVYTYINYLCKKHVCITLLDVMPHPHRRPIAILAIVPRLLFNIKFRYTPRLLFNIGIKIVLFVPPYTNTESTSKDTALWDNSAGVIHVCVCVCVCVYVYVHVWRYIHIYIHTRSMRVLVYIYIHIIYICTQ